jgi:hypothetical protein
VTIDQHARGKSKRPSSKRLKKGCALHVDYQVPNAVVLRRARIVQARAAGERSGQTALRLGCTTQGVRAVIHAFSSQLTIPSSTSVSAPGWLSVIAVVVLLILLVEKQRVAGASGGREKKLSRALTIAILPLLAALAVNVLVEVVASVSQGG